MELAIDLLREAGARLPMKVGQTLGIVGGIVIGQASVQAGLTSNILLIIVALSALASFITPIYKMGNAVRLLRFPFLAFAEIGGLFGISLGFIFYLPICLDLPLYVSRTLSFIQRDNNPLKILGFVFH